MGLAAFAAVCCLASGLVPSAQASTVPVIDSESASSVTEHDAILEAKINPEGQAVRYQFQLVLSPSEYRSEVVCPPSPGPPFICTGEHVASALPLGFIQSGSEDQPVSLDLASAGVTLQPGTTYHYRVIVVKSVQTEDTISWQGPPVYGPDQTFAMSPAVVGAPSIEGESASSITPTDATLEAQINPGGLETTYEFRLETPECQMMEGPGPMVGCKLVGSGTIPAGSATATVSTDIANAWQKLTPNTTYMYVVFAKNSAGSAAGRHEEWFKTAAASPPSIVSESISHLTSMDATLEAQINTEGLETMYEFVLTSHHACETANPPCEPPVYLFPLPGGKLLGSFVDQSVSIDLESAGVRLSPGQEYTYSVSATNAAGNTSGHPQTFTAPEEAIQPLSTTTSPGSQSPTAGPAQNAGQGTTTPPATDPVGNVTSKMTVSTNAQKLAKAVRACKHKPKKQRARCVKQAHERYGTTASKAMKR